MPRGDGNLYVTFVNVGHGDCTLICCPNGKVVIFDCGSSKSSRHLENLGTADDASLLQRAILLDEIGDNNKYLYPQAGARFPADASKPDHSLRVAALVLSHADKDHYNKLPQVFYEDATYLHGTYFEKVYYTGDFTKYRQNGFQDWITRLALKGNIEQVVFNDESNDAMREIVDGTLAGGKTCKLYILAAGYELARTQPLPEEKKRNEGSIVLKIVFGTDSMIITGDATTDTEGFMIRKYASSPTRLRAKVLRLGHHGSDTSSSPAFAGKVKPKTIVVSSRENSNNAPKKALLDQFTTLGAEPDHQIGFFDANLVWKTANSKKGIFLTAMSGHLADTYDGR